MRGRVARAVKRWLRDAVRVFAVLAVLGALVVVSGAVPIWASRGALGGDRLVPEVVDAPIDRHALDGPSRCRTTSTIRCW